MADLSQMITMGDWRLMTVDQKMDLIIRNSTDIQIFVDEHQALRDNMHIVDRFLAEAHKIAQTRDHYSARTIIEFLRHHTLIDQKNSEFKLANAMCTPIARISMLFPFLNGLFNFTTRKQ